MKRYKTSFKLLKYVFENGPNAVFWAGILIYGYGWYSTQPPLIIITSIILPIFALLITFKKVYTDAKKYFITASLDNIIKNADNQIARSDKIPGLLSAIPTDIVMRQIYNYAKDYSKNWASDAVLHHVTYYIDYSDDKIRESAQIFLFSKNRNQRLTTYFPKMGDSIEEIDELLIQYPAIKVPAIYSFKGWRKHLATIIEKSSSDINKADRVKIQISPSQNDLTFVFNYKNGITEWHKSHEILKK